MVQYRLRPYTQEEGALDLARAVRYVRYYAEEYGIDEKDIAVVGYSAGGILCGEQVLNWKGTVSPTLLDENYVPDSLDSASAAPACRLHSMPMEQKTLFTGSLWQMRMQYARPVFQ